MSNQWWYYVISLGAILILGGCSATPVMAPDFTPTAASMANPASVYCEQHAGKLDLVTDANGGMSGRCTFPDTSTCDEWAYYRGECHPGDSLKQSGPAKEGSAATPVASPTVAPKPVETTPTPAVASDGWKVYRNQANGLSFHYPADATIQYADDPPKTLTILGRLVGGDHWPVIYVNFPADRPDYRPPEGVDLAQWLTAHNLLADGRQADTQVAGTLAIHTRKDRSPQSYAADTYFFAHAGQLFSVVILHTGDKEDWTLYQHFLSSLQF